MSNFHRRNYNIRFIFSRLSIISESKMATATKKVTLEHMKGKVRDKLKEVTVQADDIQETLQELQGKVQGLVSEADKCAKDVLMSNHKSKCMKRFLPTLQKIDAVYMGLLYISDSLSSVGDESQGESPDKGRDTDSSATPSHNTSAIADDDDATVVSTVVSRSAKSDKAHSDTHSVKSEPQSDSQYKEPPGVSRVQLSEDMLKTLDRASIKQDNVHKVGDKEHLNDTDNLKPVDDKDNLKPNPVTLSPGDIHNKIFKSFSPIQDKISPRDSIASGSVAATETKENLSQPSPHIALTAGDHSQSVTTPEVPQDAAISKTDQTTSQSEQCKDESYAISGGQHELPHPENYHLVDKQEKHQSPSDTPTLTRAKILQDILKSRLDKEKQSSVSTEDIKAPDQTYSFIRPPVKPNIVKKLRKSKSSYVSSSSAASQQGPYGMGPQLSSLTFKDGSNVEVIVTHIVHPFQFWVQPQGLQLPELMENMCLFYGNPASRRSLQCAPQCGMICNAKWDCDATWYRAQITSVHAADQQKITDYRSESESELNSTDYAVDVLFVDYGNNAENIGMTGLRELPPEFTTLPRQAFCCTLSGVMPMDGSWTYPAVYRFNQLVLNQNCSAVVHIENTCPVIFIDLMIQTGDQQEQGACPSGTSAMKKVSDLLIEEGLAIPAVNKEIAQVINQWYSGQDVVQSSNVEESGNPSEVCPSDVTNNATNGTSSQCQEELLSNETNVQNTDAQVEGNKPLPSAHAFEGQVEAKNKPLMESSDSWQAIVADDDFDACLDEEIDALTVDQEQEQPIEAEKKKGSKSTIGQETTTSGRKKKKKKSSRDKSPTKPMSEPPKSTLIKYTKRGQSAPPVGHTSASNDNKENQGAEAISPQKKLQTLGMPSTLPQDCDFRGKFEKWIQIDSTPDIDHLKDSTPDRDHKHEVGSNEANIEEEDRVSISSSINDEELKPYRPVHLPSPVEPIASSDPKKDGKSSVLKDTTVNKDSHNAPSEDISDDVVMERKLKEQIIEIPEAATFQVMLSSINSPTDFYVHIVSLDTQKVIAKLEQELNKHYEKFNSIMMRFFGGFEPCVGEICIAKFSKDNTFYRAKILKVKPIYKADGKIESGLMGKKVYVFYIDYGNTEWLIASQILPLAPQFQDYPPQAVHCALASTKPVHSKPRLEEYDDYDWSPEANAEFVKLTGLEKQFLAVVVYCKEGDVFRSPDKPLQVLLCDCTAETDVWINEELASRGLTTFCQQEEEAATQEQRSDTGNDEFDGWDPMAEEYLSERNTYKIDTDDPGVATVGYGDTGQNPVCKFYARRGHCYRGDDCPYLHARNDPDIITRDKVEVTRVFETLHSVTLPMEDSWVVVEITSIFNPCHFYVVFPFGTRPLQDMMKSSTDVSAESGFSESNLSTTPGETLDTLMEQMNEYYNTKGAMRTRGMEAYALGENVAVRFTEDNNWYRGKIINTQEDKDLDNSKVEVFYVDYGNTEWVPESRVRDILPRFISFEFQAIECFLAGLEPLQEKWDTQARQCFKELAEGKTLIAHIKSSGCNGTITLDLYDTSETEVNIAKQMAARKCAIYNDYSSGKTVKKRKTKDSDVEKPIFLPG
ncbi:unnamed protein product [Owenia fusiformis]|uniref:Uncharacterized protein n=1 Tax=Owenia fusiformis TaxID=6347 RepID=A0A8S4NS65_OWEFU|nr:unnamed protein product [Owenia fusiformis]